MTLHIDMAKGSSYSVYGLRCSRCGSVIPFAYPIAVSDLVAMVKALEQKHRECGDAQNTNNINKDKT
jgi:hypothetical protein